MKEKELTHFEMLRREYLAEHDHARLPPFSIEPFPHERQRTIRPMSAEDRARRHEFLRAQYLHPREPLGDRYWPMNPIRRIYRAPMNRFETLLRVRLGVRNFSLFLCRLRSIAAHRDHFVQRPSVCPVVTLSW